jgi:hypothetical protein
MAPRETEPQLIAQLTQKELDALKQAQAQRWLTLTPDIRDAVLTYWQRECERFARPFAVVRVEQQRATLWFVLAPGHAWNDDEQGRINAALAGASGFVVTRNHARVLAEPSAAATLMRRLLAASAR